MAEILQSVAQDLKAHQQFISPSIRDLDTGRTYSIDEIEKLPQPHTLPKSEKRFDIGNLICKPFVPLIPRSMSPNTITVINNLVNWGLYILAFAALNVDPKTGSNYLIASAILNFIAMMLDCLDGMHARATNQCSKLGEFLDHWFDAIHVALVSGSIAYAFKLPTWAFVSLPILNVSLYHAQMVVYHHQRKFIQTSGVEAQIGGSSFLLIAAYLLHLEDSDPVSIAARMTLALAGFFGTYAAAHPFFKRCDAAMWEKCFVLNAHLIAFGLLYLRGALLPYQWVLVLAVLSWRVTGSLVLFSLLERPYSGHDWVISIWLAVLAWANLCMERMPVQPFYARLSHWIGDPLPGVSCQEVLPFFMCAHLTVRQLKQFSVYFYRLKTAGSKPKLGPVDQEQTAETKSD